MAVAIMLSRSTSRVAAVAGRQYFCRSGFSTAVNLSRLIIPTTRVSFARQCSSSVTRSSPSCDDSVGNQKLTLDESVVKDLLSQLQSMNDELQAIKNAKANEKLRVKEKEEEKKEVVVKQKDVVVAEIDSEISRIRIQGKKEILPEWFPFKVRKDKPGVPEITLRRVYKKETITIKVKNPWINIIDRPLATNYEFLAECGHFQMPLIVQISTPWLLFSSKSIEFHCTADRDRIVIEKIRHPADESDKGGVMFHTLDNKLCEEITKYLEVRDIMPETTEYLYGYMLNKMNRENKRVLQKFKELIEAAA